MENGYRYTIICFTCFTKTKKKKNSKRNKISTQNKNKDIMHKITICKALS